MIDDLLAQGMRQQLSRRMLFSKGGSEGLVETRWPLLDAPTQLLDGREGPAALGPLALYLQQHDGSTRGTCEAGRDLPRRGDAA